MEKSNNCVITNTFLFIPSVVRDFLEMKLEIEKIKDILSTLFLDLILFKTRFRLRNLCNDIEI